MSVSLSVSPLSTVHQFSVMFNAPSAGRPLTLRGCQAKFIPEGPPQTNAKHGLQTWLSPCQTTPDPETMSEVSYLG